MPLFLLWLIVGGFLQVDGTISNEAAYEKPPTIYMMPTYTSIETQYNGLSVYVVIMVNCAMGNERHKFSVPSPSE